jgi:hypothetical protein
MEAPMMLRCLDLIYRVLELWDTWYVSENAVPGVGKHCFSHDFVV